MQHVLDSLREQADTVQRLWESGGTCSLVGRGARARILRTARLVEAGALTPAEGLRVGAEALDIAMKTKPLPPG